MALILCPECGREISTTVKRCPHCGYKLSKKNLANCKQQNASFDGVHQTAAEPARHMYTAHSTSAPNTNDTPFMSATQSMSAAENTNSAPNTDEPQNSSGAQSVSEAPNCDMAQNKIMYEFPQHSEPPKQKKSKKKAAVAIIAIVVALVLIATALILFLPSGPADQAFLKALANGLNKRWAIQEDTSAMTPQQKAEYYIELAQFEIDELKGFDDKEYSDPELKKYAMSYIYALKNSVEATKQIAASEDYTNWNAVYQTRIIILYYINEKYGLDVENKDTLQDVLSEAKQILDYQNASSNQQQQDNKNQQQQGSSPSEEEMQAAIKEILSNTKFELNLKSGHAKYSAVVENTTGYDFDSFTYEIRLYDKEGVVLDSTISRCDTWYSGEKMTFDFSFYKNFDHYTLGARARFL